LRIAYHLIRQRLLKSGFRAELVFLCFFSRLHFLHVNGDLADLAGEFIGRPDSVVLNDWRLSIFTDIGPFVSRKAQRIGRE
jgi:hypothetical protein